MAPIDYSDWFEKTTSYKPHPWQARLGGDTRCSDRLVRIPTGFGKTAGVVGPWLFHRVVRSDSVWPRRLVFVLPMRVLVEQTEASILQWLEDAELADQVALHVLMGGCGADPWALDVERPMILLGTQDMILSRALNRGYGAARGRWPMEFGLLHQDCLWVMDEVQLMDVGLATTTQLAAFRAADLHAGQLLKPSFSWWMSATLQPSWLRTIDFETEVDALTESMLVPGEPGQAKLLRAKKSLIRQDEDLDAKALARFIHDRHQPGKLTLVIVNQVPRAVDVFDQLDGLYSEGKGKKRARRKDAPDLRLIHSHFRGSERRSWTSDFLRKGAELPPEGRVIVSTQVVEAGVDISACVLITELAPWPSLVQRMGRAARYSGEEAEVVVVGAAAKDPKKALPYEPEALAGAAEALERLGSSEADASTEALDRFEAAIAQEAPDLLARLYPYEPRHVLRREDLDDLFDTTPDLTGADLDVSRYIRSGEERDVSVFWRELPKNGSARLAPSQIDPTRPEHDELCPVPVQRLRAWLRAQARPDAYVLDYLDGAWVRVGWDRVRPGMTILLASALGGYSLDLGWNEKSKALVPPAVHGAPTVDTVASKLTATSESANLDALSASAWKTIAVHGREAAAVLGRIAQSLELNPELVRVLELAALRHDVGKAHPVFQSAIRDDVRNRADELGQRSDLAKAPHEAWKSPAYPERPGFRHELVSALSLYECLRRLAPEHPAFAERYGEGVSEDIDSADFDPRAVKDLVDLDQDSIDLIAWLIAAHHGKVRSSLTSTPHDQALGHGGIHGVCAGDILPAVEVGLYDGDSAVLPSCTLSLDLSFMGLNARYGASWTDRVQRLVRRHGAFGLAYLEALLRAADA
ncbi:MAG: HD domain-containing protein, partial [Myxococcota bacterium]